jgi:hypothetical protein
MNLDLRSVFVYTLKESFAVKFYDIGPTALLPLRRKASCGFFIALKNLLTSAGFEPGSLGSNGKEANKYTTEDNSRNHWSGFEIRSTGFRLQGNLKQHKNIFFKLI